MVLFASGVRDFAALSCKFAPERGTRTWCHGDIKRWEELLNLLAADPGFVPTAMLCMLASWHISFVCGIRS
jgi:hypothetical protein